MTTASDGMTYNPGGVSKPVVEPGSFMIAAAALDHAHIDGMCTALESAGARLKYVFEPNAAKAKSFQEKFPHVEIADSLDAILDDPEIKCVAKVVIGWKDDPFAGNYCCFIVIYHRHIQEWHRKVFV